MKGIKPRPPSSSPFAFPAHFLYNDAAHTKRETARLSPHRLAQLPPRPNQGTKAMTSVQQSPTAVKLTHHDHPPTTFTLKAALP